MEIYMQKIGMIRPGTNPKNSSLNLDIDWSVEYVHIDHNIINFNIIIRSIDNFNLDFKIEGFIELNSDENFIQNEISEIIFQKACNVLMDMISITRQSNHILSNSKSLSSFGMECVPDTLFN